MIIPVTKNDFDQRIWGLAKDFQTGEQRAVALLTAWQALTDQQKTEYGYSADDLTLIGCFLQFLATEHAAFDTTSANGTDTNRAILTKIAPFTQPT